MQPPNVFKGLVGVLIKCWGECILGTCTGWVQLVCAISKKLGQKRKSFLVYFFNSNLLFFSSQPKHAVQAYTAELFLFLSVLLCCFCWNISTNVEAIEHSWPSNNESYWLWRSPEGWDVCFWVKCFRQLLDGLPWNLVHIFMSPWERTAFFI